MEWYLWEANRGGLSPAFKEQLKYFNSDSPQEEDSDSTEQEQHTAAEIRAKLKDAIEYSKREDEEDGDKTSYIQLIMIALDHLVATQEKHRIELKTMSDSRRVTRTQCIDMFSAFSISKSTRLVHLLLPRFLALQKWHVRYTLTIMKLLTRMVT